MTSLTAPGRPLVLVGPPGSGKSTVALALAELLGVAARDTDADVEAEAGCTITDLFAERGEPAFRALERRAVVRALAEHDGVLALGGGAVLDPRTQDDLSARTVVFLDVGITDAAQRIGLNRDRPLLLGNPRATWLRLMAERRPVYERLATLTVGTDAREPADVAREIVAALAPGGGRAPVPDRHPDPHQHDPQDDQRQDDQRHHDRQGEA